MATNGYATLQQIKNWIGLSDARDDLSLDLCIEAASRTIDDHCSRRFYLDTNVSARKYKVVNPYHVVVDDIGTTTGFIFKTDDDADGTFETTWASIDLQYEPLYHDATPITLIRIVNGVLPKNCNGRAEVEITAKWGWPAVPSEVQMATLIYATRLFKRRQSPEGILGLSTEGSPIRLGSDDKDVAKLLARYQRAVFA